MSSYSSSVAGHLDAARSYLLGATSEVTPEFVDPRADDAAVAAWHKARREGLGGTDMAVVLGLSPYNNPYHLWEEKRGERESEPPDLPVERLAWGHFLEEPIALEFARRHPGLLLSDPGEGLFRAPRPLHFIQGSPDRLIVDSEGKTIGVLEIKTSANEWAVVPSYYLVQVLTYAIAVNLDSDGLCYIACLHMEAARLRFWKINLRQCMPAIKALMDVGAAFWQCVEDGTPPCQPPGEAGLDTSTLILPEHILQRYHEANSTKNALESEVEALRQQLLVALGNRRYALSSDAGFEAMLSNYPQTLFDSKRFRADHPDLHASYCSESSRTRLKVGPVKVGEKGKQKKVKAIAAAADAQAAIDAAPVHAPVDPTLEIPDNV